MRRVQVLDAIAPNRRAAKQSDASGRLSRITQGASLRGSATHPSRQCLSHIALLPVCFSVRPVRAAFVLSRAAGVATHIARGRFCNTLKPFAPSSIWRSGGFATLAAGVCAPAGSVAASSAIRATQRGGVVAKSASRVAKSESAAAKSGTAVVKSESVVAQSDTTAPKRGIAVAKSESVVAKSASHAPFRGTAAAFSAKPPGAPASRVAPG